MGLESLRLINFLIKVLALNALQRSIKLQTLLMLSSTFELFNEISFRYLVCPFTVISLFHEIGKRPVTVFIFFLT